MKRIVLATVCLLTLAGCRQKAAQAAEVTATESTETTEQTGERQFLDNADVNAQWRDKVISVKGGGAAPNIVTLLQAFQQALPTFVVDEVLKYGLQQKDGVPYKEDEYTSIVIDRKNGYADLSSPTDCDQVQATVWKRKDGHRLFAVSLYEQHVMPQNLLCWYDYDPQTETMKAERSPLEDFKPDIQLDAIGWSLPQKGTDFCIHEYYPRLPCITHVYQWDGQQHHHGKVRIENFHYQSYGEEGSERGNTASDDGWKYYALTHLGDNETPVLWLSKERNMKQCALFTPYKSHVSLIGSRCDTNPPGIEQLHFSKVQPQGAVKSPSVIVCTRDQVGGKFYTIMPNDREPYFITDLPNFSKASDEDDARMVEIEGYHTPEETEDIIYMPCEPLTPVVKQWRPFEFTKEMME